MYLLFLSACTQTIPNGEIAFYYWKTHFSLNGYEKKLLQDVNVNKIYVRYFDIERSPQDSLIKPVSVVTFDSVATDLPLVPVVYIKNNVFERIDSPQIADLSQKVRTLVAEINHYRHIEPTEIQFDCDWTDKTQNAFFYFLQQYKTLSPQTILSATIRLHQVKYKQRTGVPPADYGVLMFYNMGQISPDSSQNSIYEKETAARYIARLPEYPLKLSIALPIFSWGIQVREQKVVELVNKTYLSDFETDTHFVKILPNRFKAKYTLFKGGYYIKTNDEIKIEHITPKNLLEMVEQLRPKLADRLPINLIFYDLDSLNLIHYEPSIFYQTYRRFY